MFKNICLALALTFGASFSFAEGVRVCTTQYISPFEKALVAVYKHYDVIAQGEDYLEISGVKVISDKSEKNLVVEVTGFAYGDDGAVRYKKNFKMTVDRCDHYVIEVEPID